jgi:hypothetical protein
VITFFIGGLRGRQVQEAEEEVQTNVQMYSSVVIREGIQIFDNFIIKTSTRMQNVSKRAYRKGERGSD